MDLPRRSHMLDSHEATAAWDVYSLGRVAAWGSLGIVPTPNVDLGAPEPWRRFGSSVDRQRCKQAASGHVPRVIELLATGGHRAGDGRRSINETLQRAKEGDTNATVQVLAAAGDYLDDGAFFIDELAHVLGTGLQEFVWKVNPQQLEHLSREWNTTSSTSLGGIAGLRSLQRATALDSRSG